jgi:hypothetical protein
MGNDKLEIISCRIPALAQQLAGVRAQRLAEYPLARASEWSPLAGNAILAPIQAEETEDR